MKKITESINDKNLFKAVFMAGGPGSGKSFMASNLFGFKGNEVFSHTGAMLVNSDSIFEKKLIQAGLPKKMDSENEPEIYAKQMDVRNSSKRLTGMMQDNLINGMLPLIIDGTGKNYELITNQSRLLKNIGYDVSMVFVNTSLDTALKRNAQRDRVVDPKVVSDIWYQVQNNIGKFQEYFGPENFIVIDANTSYAKDSKEMEAFRLKLYKMGSKLLNRPLKNPKGIKILELLKATGGKYLSDLPSNRKDLKESCQKYLGCVPWVLINVNDIY